MNTYKYYLQITVVMILAAFILGCSSSGESKGFQASLNQQMTHSYCYQYMYGDYGSAINYEKAFHWCSRAVLDGNPNSMVLLAEIYYFGYLGSADYNKAYYWYLEAANKKHAHGQYMVSYLYQHGLGVQKSDAEATKWLNLAKAGKHPHIKSQTSARFKTNHK